MVMVLERPVAPESAMPAAPDTLTIDVRQEHIDRGVPRAFQTCPIALAAKEATGATWVSMALAVLWIGNHEWFGDETVAAFTSAFDCGVPVHPSRFVFKRARRAA
jgi:hypothetical protein